MPSLAIEIFQTAELLAKNNNQPFSPIHILDSILRSQGAELLIVRSGGDYRNLKKQIEELIEIDSESSVKYSREQSGIMEKLYADIVRKDLGVGDLLLQVVQLKYPQVRNILRQNNVNAKEIEKFLHDTDEEFLPDLPHLTEWDVLEVVADTKEPSLIVAEDGKFDLAAPLREGDLLGERIDGAHSAIDNLITRCGRGNMQHSDLGVFAQEYKSELSKLSNDTPGISWYLIAQKIENYRSNYVALSKEDPGEYPRLDPGFSATIDSVVLATGIIARILPEIAKCQDDFYTYAGLQTGVRIKQRELLDAALSDLASAQEVMTPRAAIITKKIAELDTGASTEISPEVARTVATKAGFIRSFVAALASEILRVGKAQMKYLADNIRTKAAYDFSKEITKLLILDGYSKTIGLMENSKIIFSRLAESWPAMFDFIPAVLRLLGL